MFQDVIGTDPSDNSEVKNFLAADLEFTMGNPLDDKSRNRFHADRLQAEKEAILEYLATHNALSQFKKKCRSMLPEAARDPLRYWLRGISGNVLKYASKRIGTTGSLHHYPTQWQWGDSFSDLDAMRSLQTNPLFMFPPFAKKWKKTNEGFEKRGHVNRDLVIVVDSSRSMWWNADAPPEHRGPFHAVMISGFALIDMARRYNIKVSVINFSDNADVLGWVNPSIERDRIYAEDFVMLHKNGITCIPAKELSDLLVEKTQALIIIITDSKIQDWEQKLPYFTQLLHDGHLISMMVIGRQDQSSHITPVVELKKLSCHIHFIEHYHDLPSLTIGEASLHSS